MNVLRSTTRRDFVGIINPKLYETALSGTKELIRNYLKGLANALDFIAMTTNISKKEKIKFFSELKHTYGRTCIFLSGGGQLGFYHLGLIKAFMENNLYPKIWAGSSAGA